MKRVSGSRHGLVSMICPSIDQGPEFGEVTSGALQHLEFRAYLNPSTHVLYSHLPSSFLPVLFLQIVNAMLDRLSNDQLLVVAALRLVLTREWKRVLHIGCSRK